MKIMIIMPTFYPAIEYGGPIFSVLHFCNSLSEVSSVSVLTTNRRRLSETLRTHPTENIAFPIEYLPYQFAYLRFSQIAKATRTADVVVINSIFSPFILMCFLISVWQKKKIILKPRGSLGKFGMQKRYYLKLIFIYIYKIIGRNTEFMVTSIPEKSEVTQYFGCKRKVGILSNGIENSWLHDSGQLNMQKENKCMNVCFVGRLQQKKRIDLLISAMSILQTEMKLKYQLHIIGADEGQRDFLENLAARKLIPGSFVFYGLLDRPTVKNILASMDCLVLASENENFGNVILEALSVNIPVVVSKNLPWSHLHEKRLGVTCDLNPSSISAAIRTASQLDLRKNASGTKFISDNYTWDAIAKTFLEYL